MQVSRERVGSRVEVLPTGRLAGELLNTTRSHVICNSMAPSRVLREDHDSDGRVVLGLPVTVTAVTVTVPAIFKFLSPTRTESLRRLSRSRSLNG